MIVVFGATGLTGKMVVKEVLAAGGAVRVAVRDQTKMDISSLPQIDVFGIDLEQPKTIKAALQGATVAINCIGPFTKFGMPLAQVIVNEGIHYVDTTGEQIYIKMLFEQIGARAKAKHVCLAPACAFEYAIADTLAALATSKLGECDRFEFTYKVRGAATSLGTRRSILKQLEHPWFRLENGQLCEIRTISVSMVAAKDSNRLKRFIEFPGGEALLLPLHNRTRFVKSIMQISSDFPILPFPLPTALLRTAAAFPITGALMAAAMTKDPNPTAEALDQVSAEIICIAKQGDKQVQTSAIVANPYAVTAVIAASLARQLQEGASNHSGPCSPSMISGANFIREITESRGVEWQV